MLSRWTGITHPPTSNLIIKDAGLRKILTDTSSLELANSICPDKSVVINIDELDPGVSDSDPDIPITADTIAALYYTSGSTGNPKGIIKKHGALQYRPYGFGPGSRQAHLSSFAFSAALSTIFSALLSGAAIYFYPVKEWGIGRLYDWLNENRINIFSPPVSLFHQFVEILQPDDFLRDLRLVTLAGQRVNIGALKMFRSHISPDCLIKHHLASSEAGSSSAYFITQDTILDDDYLPIGYPTIDKQVLIVDENGQGLPPGEIGEIVVKGRSVASGYWGEAKIENEKFKPDPQGGLDRLIYTGDMGVLRQDGLLEYRGRKDEMVKISGYRVELPLVKSSLLHINGVREAAVIAGQTDFRQQHAIDCLPLYESGKLPEHKRSA